METAVDSSKLKLGLVQMKFSVAAKERTNHGVAPLIFHLLVLAYPDHSVGFCDSIFSIRGDAVELPGCCKPPKLRIVES